MKVINSFKYSFIEFYSLIRCFIDNSLAIFRANYTLRYIINRLTEGK